MLPILYNISTFDAGNDKSIEFKWEGNQAFKNRCRIRDNVTNSIVYEVEQTTMQLRHIIPANTLTNGKLYNIQIATVDSAGTVSDYSNSVLFYCFTTPTFNFTNVVNNQVIQNSSYQVSLEYSQPEGETLRSFEIILYDMSKSIINTSGILYTGMNDLTYTLTDLDDNSSCYIRAIGITTNGMEIETEYIYFSVNYEQPSVYSILTLENLNTEGYIKLQSNINVIECYTDKPPIFVDGEYIDLTDNTIGINEGFSFENDFIINFSGYNFSKGLIMQLFNGITTINTYYRTGVYDVNNHVEKAYLELYVPIGFTKYCCYSNYIDVPTEKEQLSVWITKHNGLFEISVSKEVGD